MTLIDVVTKKPKSRKILLSELDRRHVLIALETVNIMEMVLSSIPNGSGRTTTVYILNNIKRIVNNITSALVKDFEALGKPSVSKRKERFEED